MHPNIIKAIDERYKGANPKAITRAQKAGTFELILVSLGNYDLLQKILEELKTQRDHGASGDE